MRQAIASVVFLVALVAVVGVAGAIEQDLLSISSGLLWGAVSAGVMFVSGSAAL